MSLPQGIQHSNAKAFIRGLMKAVKYLNSDEGGSHNIGLDVEITSTEIRFHVREKQRHTMEKL